MGWFQRQKEARESVDQDLQQYYDDTINGRVTTEVTPSKKQTDTLVASKSSGKTLRQTAMDNCVEFERAYSHCLLKGSLWERFTSCPTQKAMHDQCKEMQTHALEVLGWRSAGSADAQQNIKTKADDLMIKYAPSLIITESQVAAFNDDLNRSVRDS